jgi:hypothetical protein
MKKPSASTVVIALLLGVLLGVAFSNILTAKSSAEVSSYDYSHLAFVAVENRIVAIDLRYGDAWDVSARIPQRDVGSSPPLPPSASHLGNLGLHRLSESKKIVLEATRR